MPLPVPLLQPGPENGACRPDCILFEQQAVGRERSAVDSKTTSLTSGRLHDPAAYPREGDVAQMLQESAIVVPEREVNHKGPAIPRGNNPP